MGPGVAFPLDSPTPHADLTPTGGEQRSFGKAYANFDGESRIHIRSPKPLAGFESDPDALDELAIRTCQKAKKWIEEKKKDFKLQFPIEYMKLDK